MNASRRSAPGLTVKSALDWVGQRIGLGVGSSRFWGSVFGVETWAGESVTPQKAMMLSAVNRAVRLTAETKASLPVSMYVDGPDGPVLERGGETDTLMRVSPNADQSPMEFWEQMYGCQELIGEGLARKHWNFNRTRVVALTLMDPTRTRDIETASGNDFYWEYHDPRGRRLDLARDDVFNLPGFSLGGRRGMSTVRYGAQTMSLAMAAEKTAGRLFASGLRNSGFLNAGQVLNPEDREKLEKIMAQYMGSGAAGGLMILEGGMTFTPMNMSSVDAELLLTRRFQIEDTGRWFGMPPILLGHAVEGQTMWGSGVDSIIQAWMTLGLRQRIVRTQQAVQKRLMTAEERARGLYAKMNSDALLAVNSTARINFITQAVQNSLLTPDEGRALLERGKMPGGDQLLAQVNLVPLAMLGDKAAQDPQVRAAFRAWLGIEDQPNADLPRLQ
jgi:HK97 family phage portal protein